MKKSLALLMTLIMVFSLCAIAPSAYAADKTVINVMSFTDEVPNMINRYVETHPDLPTSTKSKPPSLPPLTACISRLWTRRSLRAEPMLPTSTVQNPRLS